MADERKSWIVGCARENVARRKSGTPTSRLERHERVNGALTFIGSRSYAIPEDQTTMNNLAVSYRESI
ncbi:hypothetical protein WN51_01114 [Melipona quadrifasciata]|uniref:Uncharacterized protein n=1 Tax=Melipona quadrifasciata TaxID=166423 RepID=A0A0N1ITE3_9HYME|nr:hypothetical protein WN51_01114 [Melipona quadrifasciata]